MTARSARAATPCSARTPWRAAASAAAAAAVLAACSGPTLPLPTPPPTTAPTTSSPSGSPTDTPTTDGPTSDGPTTDGPTSDGPSTDGPTATTGSLAWSDCTDDDLDGLQCAEVEVPLDYDDPGGRTLKILAARLPATGTAERAVFTNPGGPGASGAEFLAGWGPTVSAEVRATSDLVSFDPRGVGRSGQLACVPYGESLEGAPSGLPASAAAPEIREADARSREQAEACRTAEGADVLAHVGTVEVARDMDRLREAMGLDKIDYLGFSYGTRLGATYARLFGGRLRTLTLDGSVSPHETMAEFAEGQARGGALALAGFSRDCAADPDCPLEPGAEAAWDRVVALAERSPLPVDGEPDRRVDGAVATTGMYSGLYSPSQWPGLRRAMVAALGGDGTQLFELAQFQVGEPVDGFSADLSANLAVNCADIPDRPTTAQAAALAARLTPSNPRFGVVAAVSAVSCSGWSPGADPVGTVALAAPAPTVVVGTRNDPATPYTWAVAMKGAVAGSRLITYEGQGHTAYGTSACVTKAVDAMLLTGRAPAADLRCTDSGGDAADRARQLLTAALGPALERQGLPKALVACLVPRLVASLSDAEVSELMAGGTPDGFQEKVAGLTRACLVSPSASA